MPCLLSAFDEFLDDEFNQKTGQAVETAHDKLFYYEIPEYKGGEVSERNTKVYEPWFTLMHGERSELASALRGPPKRK
jgi:general stress protein YciG